MFDFLDASDKRVQDLCQTELFAERDLECCPRHDIGDSTCRSCLFYFIFKVTKIQKPNENINKNIDEENAIPMSNIFVNAQYFCFLI